MKKPEPKQKKKSRSHVYKSGGLRKLVSGNRTFLVCKVQGRLGVSVLGYGLEDHEMRFWINPDEAAWLSEALGAMAAKRPVTPKS